MSRFLDTLSVTPLPDGKLWRVNSDFRYLSDILMQRVVVPGPDPPRHGGRVTDFASIPQPLQALFPVWDRYGAAALIHDELYWRQVIEREVADMVLREAMQVLAVPNDTANTIYLAVRIGGQPAWNRNAELKASGYSRMAAAGSTPPYAAVI